MQQLPGGRTTRIIVGGVKEPSAPLTRESTCSSEKHPNIGVPRRSGVGSSYVTLIKVEKWADLMKAFTEKHKEKCTTKPLEYPRFVRTEKNFPTGSSYEGPWDEMGMNGFGTYTYPNGVIYEGEFEDNMLHGKGELRYKGGSVIRGKWKNGVMTNRTLLFSDTLEYNEKQWKYCTMPDRRFAVEYDIDLMPAGKSFLTADQPTKEIPHGYYDTGDGFFDPKTKVVYKYDDLTSIIRAPSVQEQKWIVDNCRLSPEEPLGPRPDLYERYLEPALVPAPQPPPSAGVKTTTVTSFRKQSLFEQDDSAVDSGPMFYDASKFSDNDSGGFRPFRRFRLADID